MKDSQFFIIASLLFCIIGNTSTITTLKFAAWLMCILLGVIGLISEAKNKQK